jgi:hypothetical protein
MSTMKALSRTFKLLDSLLYVDPEDLAIAELEKIYKIALIEYNPDSNIEEAILTEHAHRHSEIAELFKEKNGQ